MGYTHYWTRSKTLPKRKFNAAVADCRKVVECLTRERGLALKYDSDQPEPPCLDGVAVWFNGEGEDGHETFHVPREFEPTEWASLRQNGRGPWRDFTKTDRKPYDLAVCCCLLVFRHHFGTRFGLTSDGHDYEENWPQAREVCQRVLGYGREYTLVPRFTAAGPVMGGSYDRGHCTETYFAGGFKGKVLVAARGHFAPERVGTFDPPIAPIPAGVRSPKKVQLYGLDYRTGGYDRLCACRDLDEAKWRAVVYYVAFVCSRVGAEGYEGFINSLLEAHFAWHDLAVFCDFLDDQGKGDRVRMLLPEVAGVACGGGRLGPTTDPSRRTAMYLGPVRKGMRVRIAQLGRESVATVTGTGRKDGQRVVLLDDDTWAYARNIVEVVRDETGAEPA